MLDINRRHFGDLGCSLEITPRHNFTLAAGRGPGGAIVQETIIFNGTIIGEGQRLECEVRATKTTLNGDSPVFSNYRIMESDLTDSLPDGNYELLVNRERTRFSRDAGRFLSRPY